MNKPNLIIARKVTQNQQEFLLSVVKVSDLLRYTRYTERVVLTFDENNLPVYNSEIQRRPDTSKINSIVNYLLNDPNAMFPTNIVLAVPSFVINDFIENNDEITITLMDFVENELKKSTGNIYITIIDGQHRLRGIEAALEKLKNDLNDSSLFFTSNQRNTLEEKLDNLYGFEIAISFFIDPVIEYQAAIFASINRTQTKVSESLVYSLFGLTDKVSPQKTALDVALALNSFKGSPFFGKIKLVGQKYKRGESPVLTQATVVKSIIKCISPSASKAEEERFLERSALLSGVNSDLYFRKYYALNQDSNITKIMFAYFKAIQNVFKSVNGTSYWNSDVPENILNTTVGYETMLNLLKKILNKIPYNDSRFDITIYENILRPIEDFPFEDIIKYPKTSVTKSLLLSDLTIALGI